MSSLRIVSDPDDAMGADPEDPREDLGGYGKAERHDARATLEPRGPRRASAPTHWAIVERAGAAPAPADAARKVCRKCNEASSVLHQHPQQMNDTARTICGRCQGDIRRGML